MFAWSKSETPPIQNIYLSNTQIWTFIVHTQTDLYPANYHLPEKITEVHPQIKQMFQHTSATLPNWWAPNRGEIHRYVFSLFFSIWNNPDTKIYEIVKYLLKESTENSRTWSIFIRQLSVMYGLTDPLQCLQSDPPQKSVYKEHILTKVTAFHEKELRQNSLSNSNMMYLNVSVFGLRGKRHPSLSNLLTAFNVKKSRPHLKMLCMDYYTLSLLLSSQSENTTSRKYSTHNYPVCCLLRYQRKDISGV